MKSLDGLIQRLVEEVALCGDYGAGTSDFITYVNGYYHPKPEVQDESSTSSCITTAVDRRFLEKTWEWLTQNPEIEIGEGGWGNKLSLTEVEYRNRAAATKPNNPVNDASSTPQHPRESFAPSTTSKDSRISGSHSSNNPNDPPLDHTPVVIRMYASTERRWQAITGHASDRTKVPRLDFACLSIIAAHREQGILQPQLITISGQDKRSVPERTKRLHEAGYIAKVPVFWSKSHTSRLTLKRYVKETGQGNNFGRAVDARAGDIPPAHTSTPCPVDFLPLQQQIFDILREVKLITFNGLKAKLGFNESPWYKRLFARHMRRLERIGCIKQVRARPQIEAATPFLFRCIKYVRDPEGREWMPFQFASRHQSKLTGVEDPETEIPCNDEQDYQAEEAQFLAGHGGSQHSHQLEEVKRPVPQWSGDENFSNLLFKLVHASGQSGMSTLDIKNRSMGCFTLRPTENHLSRLVEMWQISQPLHLRHLCIIRDAALTNGVPHYIHYSFENFQKLVDEGKASWDSVMTITKEHKDFVNLAALEAKPELDDNGFPQLSSSLFHRPHCQATLAECSRGTDISPLPRSGIEPEAVKSKNGNWGIRSEFHTDCTAVRKQSHNSTFRTGKVPQIRNRRRRGLSGGEPNLIVTNAGRPRKQPRAEWPIYLDRTSYANQKKLSGSQMAAIRYKKIKIVTEIEKQVAQGGDRFETTAAMLKLAIEQYHSVGEEPPWNFLEEIRRAALAPCLLALHYSKNVTILNGAVGDWQGILRVSDYKPSAAAHSLPVGAIELKVIEDIMEPRIRLLELIAIDDKFKKSTSEIVLEAIRHFTQATGAVGQPFQSPLSRKQHGMRGKSKSRITNNPGSNIPIDFGHPTSGNGIRKIRAIHKKAIPTSASSRSSNSVPGRFSLHSGGNIGQYPSSIAAHTQPFLAEDITTKKTLQSKTKNALTEPIPNKRRYNRRKKSVAVSDMTPVPAQQDGHLSGLLPHTQGVVRQYLPSVAAHSWPITLGGLSTESPVTSKRKLALVDPRQTKKPKQASRKKVQLDLVPDVVTPTPAPPSSQGLGMQTYEQQVNSVARLNVGCFVGRAVSLYQPGKRGRRRKSRLAIFKSPRIQGLACLSTSLGFTPMTQVQQQTPAGLNQRNHPNEHQTDTMHADNSIPVGPPSDIPSASVTQYITPGTLADLSMDTVYQSQGDGSSDQRRLTPPEQSLVVPVSSPPSTIVHPLLDASYTGEHIRGTKRKRTINDEARRRVFQPRQDVGASDNVISLTLADVRSASDQGELVEEDPRAPYTTTFCDGLPGQVVQNLISSGDSCTAQDNDEPSFQAAVRTGDSQSQAVQPNAEKSQCDHGFDGGLTAHPNIFIRLSVQSDEIATTYSNAEITQQQHAFSMSEPVVRAVVGKTPSFPPNEQNQDLAEHAVPLGQNSLPKTIEDTSSVNVPEADPSMALGHITLEASLPAGSDQEVEGNNDGVAESDALDPLFRDTHVVTAGMPTSEVVAGDSAGPRRRKGVRKMRPQGGSIAAQRRKIVMDIVRRCGGVYPGVPELGVPFKEQWSKSGYSGTAETATLKAVVDYLCETNRLRRILFVFKDTKGVHVRKNMITTTEINTTDPKVFALQDRIKSLHPSWYFPEDLGSLDEVRIAYRHADGPMKNRTIKDLELDEGRVLLQQKSVYDERYEVEKNIRRKRLAKEERQVAKMRAILAKGKYPSSSSVFGQSSSGSHNGPEDPHPLLSIAKKHNVDRLASIRNRTNNPGSLGSTNRDFSPDLSQDTIMNIASGWADEMHKAVSPQAKESLTFTPILGIENFESGLKSQTIKDEEHEMAIKRIMACYAAEGIVLEPYLPSTAPPESRTREAKRPRKRFAPESHSKAARQQMYTIMEPEHLFHSATGTFSVNFSPFRTINQIRKIYHWRPLPQEDFYKFVDDSERWELRTEGLQDAKFEEWTFINYVFPHRHQTKRIPGRSTKRSRHTKDPEIPNQSRASNQMLDDITPDEQLLVDLTATQPQPSPSSDHGRRESTSGISAVATSPAPTHKASNVPAKRRKTAPQEQFKTRRLTAVNRLPPSLRPDTSRDALGEVDADRRHRRLFDVRRVEAPSPDITQRILTAVVVVRTLTGGIERNIDWILVAKVFGTAYTPLYLSKIWPKALQAHKVQAEMIRTGFQQLFLRAYDEGLVPPLDYDNLEDYNWPWLVDWTIERLDTPINCALDLPLQRDKIDQAFDFEVGEDPDMNAYYELCTGSARVHRRESELHKKAWVQPLISKSGEQSVTSPNKLDVVKTWIRANIATSGQVYQPHSAADRLRQFDERLRRQALNELHRESVFMHRNKGRAMPGRQYAFSQNYLKPLKQKIEVAHLQQAALFKREIDETLANDREMVIPQLADDAFTLAVQNMQAHRRVLFVAKNPPMDKFGLSGVGNYKGRQIPKSKYYFDVGLQATDRYREGNPLLPLPEPPSVPASDSDADKIPLWYDIHGNVIKDLWEMTVAAVMSILITRPGVSIYAVEPSVRPTLGLWEVQMLLDWMVEAKAARKMGGSYTAEEWWWLCLDSGRTFEEERKLQDEEEMRKKEELRKEEQTTAVNGEVQEEQEERDEQRWE
ncbi:MAG: hypothetical protein Q9197_000982 [Variospora fuerteventurae]